MGNLPEWSVGGKKLTGQKLNFYIAFIASNGFLMFGYDQGVLSALITLQSWQTVFPLMTPRELPNDLCWIDGDRNNPDPNQCTGDANLQAFAIAIYQVSTTKHNTRQRLQLTKKDWMFSGRRGYSLLW
jgi:hypothetical protein